MRDAFGRAFMIRLFLVFIFIYMFFTAIALNYAKAFKVKNRIIDYLEDNEIMDLNGQNASEYDKMDKFIEEELLGTLNYHVDTSTMDCKKEEASDGPPPNPPPEGIRFSTLTWKPQSVPVSTQKALYALVNVFSGGSAICAHSTVQPFRPVRVTVSVSCRPTVVKMLLMPW